MKRAIRGLADYGTKGETEYLQSNEYLLNKLMISFQAILIVLCIAVLSGSLVTGWNAMLPKKDLRQSISDQSANMENNKTLVQELEKNIKQMDANWTNKSSQHDSLIKAYNMEYSREIEAATTENAELANRISKLSSSIKQQFERIGNYYSQNENDNNASKYHTICDEVENFLYNKLDAPQDSKQLLLKYNENWLRLMLLKLEPNISSENQLRSKIQPTYDAAKTRLEETNELINSEQQELSRFQKEAAYDVLALLRYTLFGFLAFILLVWVVGLIIESLWLAIHVAANVQKIKENLGSK